MDEIAQACDKLFRWYEEGRQMPGYVPQFGRPYIAMLLGLTCSNTLYGLHVGFNDRFKSEYKDGKFTLAEDICGPNGWAMLQYYIARAGISNDGPTKGGLIEQCEKNEG